MVVGWEAWVGQPGRAKKNQSFGLDKIGPHGVGSYSQVGSAGEQVLQGPLEEKEMGEDRRDAGLRRFTVVFSVFLTVAVMAIVVGLLVGGCGL